MKLAISFFASCAMLLGVSAQIVSTPIARLPYFEKVR